MLVAWSHCLKTGDSIEWFVLLLYMNNAHSVTSLSLIKLTYEINYKVLTHCVIIVSEKTKGQHCKLKVTK
jgi:hypothetical protein